MKKILSIFLLIFAIGCSFKNEKIRVDFTIEDKKSSIGEGIELEVTATDNRSSKYVLGIKRIGKKKIEVQNYQEVDKILQERIALNLLERGFKLGKENKVQISLESLKYNAKNKILIATSTTEVDVKIITTNNRSKKSFSKNYRIALTGKHFVLPTKSSQEKAVNSILQEVTEEILSDDAFLKALIRP